MTRVRLHPCKACGREGHPGRTCDVAQLDRSAVTWTKARESELANAPVMLVVSRRPHLLPGCDRERRLEVLECRHEVTVFASEPLDPTRRCDRCPPPAEPDDPTPAARATSLEGRASLARPLTTDAERPRAGQE